MSRPAPLNDFPFWSKTLPPFREMFDALRQEKLAACPGDRCADVLVRKYPQDFRRVDGVSNRFTERARIHASIGGHPTPAETWKALKASSPGQEAQSNEQLRELVYSAGRECNTFNPAFALLLYRRYGAKGGHVLDLSSGWGCRAIAAAAAEAGEYFGYDPNPLLKKGHADLIRAVKAAQEARGLRPTSVILTADPAELRRYPDGTANVVLVSPPYYDHEIYAPPGSAEAAGQSTERPSGGLRTYDEWMDEFLAPYYAAGARALAPGGALIVYVGDFRDRRGVVRPLQRDSCRIINGIRGLHRGPDFGLRVVAGADSPHDRRSNRRGERVRRVLVYIRRPEPATVVDGRCIYVAGPRAQHMRVRGTSGQRLHALLPPLWCMRMWGGIAVPSAETRGIIASVMCSDECMAATALLAQRWGLTCHIVVCIADHRGNKLEAAQIDSLPWVIAARGYNATVIIAGGWASMCEAARKLARDPRRLWLSDTYTTLEEARDASDRFFRLGWPSSARRGPGATIWTSMDPQLLCILALGCTNPIIAVPARHGRGMKGIEILDRQLATAGIPRTRVTVRNPNARINDAERPLAISEAKDGRLWSVFAREARPGDVVVFTGRGAPTLV